MQNLKVIKSEFAYACMDDKSKSFYPINIHC